MLDKKQHLKSRRSVDLRIAHIDVCGGQDGEDVSLQAFGDDAAAIKDFGADVVAALCERLRAGGAPSLHFYTLNQSVATLEVCRRLGRCD